MNPPQLFSDVRGVPLPFIKNSQIEYSVFLSDLRGSVVKCNHGDTDCTEEHGDYVTKFHGLINEGTCHLSFTTSFTGTPIVLQSPVRIAVQI
jgi:hypothetical protein